MTERARPIDTSAARRPPPVPERAGAMDPGVRTLVERAAILPGGVALLDGAALECAAVLLGVTPRLLERARAALQDHRVRGEALEIAAHAAARHPSAPARAEAPVSGGRRLPEEVVLAAQRSPGGRALLLSAAPECAAIAFGVHPDVVLAARELARRGGLSPDPSDPDS